MRFVQAHLNRMLEPLSFARCVRTVADEGCVGFLETTVLNMDMNLCNVEAAAKRQRLQQAQAEEA